MESLIEWRKRLKFNQLIQKSNPSITIMVVGKK